MHVTKQKQAQKYREQTRGSQCKEGNGTEAKQSYGINRYKLYKNR